MGKLVAWLLLMGAACLIAVGVGMAVLAVANAVLPPFGVEDDDTMREFGPVALAYGSMGITALLGAVWSWRRVHRSG
jgi:uncharacterized membrane protein YidH (DUF202 family)